MKLKAAISLIVIPIVFAWINLAYLSVLFPIFSGPPGYDQDPAYMYLFNGVLMIDGQGPWQVDHPGTSLQFLSTVGVLIARVLFSIAGRPMNPGMVDDVLADPEPYLYVMSCLLLAMNAAALLYLGFRVRIASERLGPAWLCQLGGLAFGIVTPKAAYVSPDALQIFATFCILGQLAPLIFSDPDRIATDDWVNGRAGWSAKWIGFFCGLGLTAKLTFAPIFALTLLVRPARKLLTVVIFASVSVLLLLLPTYKNLVRFSGWILGIASHSGMHGGGANTVFDPSLVPQHLRLLLTWYPLLYGLAAALLGYLLIAIARNRADRSADRTLPVRVALVILLSILAQTLLVLKHPGAHYMVPVLPVAYTGLAWLLFQVGSELRRLEPRRSSYLRSLAAGTALLIGLYGVVPTVLQIDRMRAQRVAQDQALAVIGAQLQQYPDALVICAWRCTMPKYATALGLLYAPGLATRPIVRDLLANYYEYNFLVREFIAPGFDTLSPEAMSAELARGRKVFLVTPKDYPDLAVFDLKKVVSTDPLTLYEVTGIRSGASG